MTLGILLFILLVLSAASTTDPSLRRRRLGICAIMLLLAVFLRLLT